MILELKVHHLRNINYIHLNLHHKFNFIHGVNGSGKTSILEALYMLSCGSSFRTRETSPLIQDGHNQLTVFAKKEHEEQISITKSMRGQTVLKKNNQICSKTSELAYALPCAVFYSDIFDIIDAGASVRRSIFDWGLFHVKQEYLLLLKTYKRILKQRNTLLKKEKNYASFYPWDKQLGELADQIHNLREHYFKNWMELFQQTISHLSPLKCSLTYYKGWDKKNTHTSLPSILQENFASDQKRQFTQYGIHQADIIIEQKDRNVKHYLSRGQQKVISIALKLAQAHFINKPCLFLFDDFTAELDEQHQQNLIKYLTGIDGQFVITTTCPIFSNEHLTLPTMDSSFFSIDHGEVSMIDSFT